MQTEPQIVFHGLDSSEAIRKLVLEELAKLERHYDRLVTARVAIEKDSDHGPKGVAHHVKIELEVPGPNIVVKSKGDDPAMWDDLPRLIRETFASALRELEEFKRKRSDRERGRSH
ncbi:Ribosome-associated translation inhibitor RaiA [Meinhardsimonia xiamenensis]|jgi:ribosome-associated translation inhibitor RaiA|uniref:Ribosome-associated translation inhibitor RaiA n=1 Tax=Meinhardsimonia xiamenensis TaxID=990712 RepID=A0A1G9CUY8_9RHOB|nr:HPF/RaiA family ribosome-associated protein [Meinhardsimonia xiamenensis]PRX38236.1 ribosome-associated translation inhibitor RaiA [Meinhardsimonia xiamenensis]SDK55456.1 Ribosome-associated translation inhibitor RaiA [Meinhardsimonia xiamenensis]